MMRIHLGLLKLNVNSQVLVLRKKTNWKAYYNTICGSSSFINGKGRDKDGKVAKINEGIEDRLLKLAIDTKKIDKDQYYLQ